MGAKVTFSFLDKWNEYLSGKEFKSLVADYIVDHGIKAMVSRGDSPVKNHARFKGYSVDRNKGNPRFLYPNNVKDKYPDKLRRPVNLYLSGDYLSKLGVKEIKNGFEVGFFSLTPKQREMFEMHNNGANPKVPMRKHLPTKEGEELKEVIIETFTRGLLRAFKHKKIID